MTYTVELKPEARIVVVSRKATPEESEILGGAKEVALPGQIPEHAHPSLRDPDVAALVQAMKDGFEEIVEHRLYED